MNRLLDWMNQSAWYAVLYVIGVVALVSALFLGLMYAFDFGAREAAVLKLVLSMVQVVLFLPCVLWIYQRTFRR